jgi:hypothetical protein
MSKSVLWRLMDFHIKASDACVHKPLASIAKQLT